MGGYLLKGYHLPAIIRCHHLQGISLMVPKDLQSIILKDIAKGYHSRLSLQCTTRGYHYQSIIY